MKSKVFIFLLVILSYGLPGYAQTEYIWVKVTNRNTTAGDIPSISVNASGAYFTALELGSSKIFRVNKSSPYLYLLTCDPSCLWKAIQIPPQPNKSFNYNANEPDSRKLTFTTLVNNTEQLEQRKTTVFTIKNNLFGPTTDFSFGWFDYQMKDWVSNGWYTIKSGENKQFDFGIPYNRIYFYCKNTDNGWLRAGDKRLYIDQVNRFDFTYSETKGELVGFKNLKDSVIDVVDIANNLVSNYIYLKNSGSTEMKCVIALLYENATDYELIGTYTLKPGEERNMNFGKVVVDLLTYWENKSVVVTWKRDPFHVQPESWEPTQYFYIGGYGTGFKYLSGSSTGNRKVQFYRERKRNGKFQSIL